MLSTEFVLMLKELVPKFSQSKEMIMFSIIGCTISKIFLLSPKENYLGNKFNLRFVKQYDGVNVLLKDRSEVGKYFV